MKKASVAIFLVIILCSLSGCNNSAPSKTTNNVEHYIEFTDEDLSDSEYFDSYIEDSRLIEPSEIIAKNVDYVVYRFIYKSQKPEIIWYDKDNQELEYLTYNDDSAERCIYTDDYKNESLPDTNSNGDTLVYREPISEHGGDCLYDENGRVITEFVSQSELYEYRYRPDGKLARETYIEIDYYDIDWKNAFKGSGFSEDEANDAVFDSVHLNYYYDEYIYDSNNLLVKTEKYFSDEEKPFSYEKYEYNSDNRIIKSYYGRYEDNTIGYIDYYEYRK